MQLVRRHCSAASVLVVVFGLLASLYSVVTPLWEAPDEIGHFAFIAHLLTDRSLPQQRLGFLGEAHQPPLYYVIAAAAAAPANLGNQSGAFEPNPRFMGAGQGGNDVSVALHGSAESFPFGGQALAVHLARLASVIMGMVTVAFTIAIGYELFPNRKLIGLAAGALVALNPQFLFISGSVNNDNALAATATGAIWQLLRAARKPEQWRQWGYLGIWVSLAVMAKLSGVTVGILGGTALLIMAVQRRSLRVFVRGSLAMVLVAAALTGWWFVYNQMVYGDPLGWAFFRKVHAVTSRQGSLGWNDLPVFFSTQFGSFWGAFGWMNVWPPAWFYSAVQVLSVAGLGGLAVFVTRRGFAALSGPQRAGLATLAAAVVLQELFTLWLITGCDASCYQGRYLFAVIGPLMVLLGLGVVSILPRRIAPLLVSFVTLLLVANSLYMALGVIMPAYQSTALPKSGLESMPDKSQLTGQHTLLQLGLSPPG